MDALSDVTGVAALLGVSRGWLYRQCRTRVIPHTRVAGRIRFAPEHVAAIIAAGEQPAAPPAVRLRAAPTIHSKIRKASDVAPKAPKPATATARPATSRAQPGRTATRAETQPVAGTGDPGTPPTTPDPKPRPIPNPGGAS
jgi:hypothetical protein